MDYRTLTTCSAPAVPLLCRRGPSTANTHHARCHICKVNQGQSVPVLKSSCCYCCTYTHVQKCHRPHHACRTVGLDGRRPQVLDVWPQLQRVQLCAPFGNVVESKGRHEGVVHPAVPKQYTYRSSRKGGALGADVDGGTSVPDRAACIQSAALQSSYYSCQRVRRSDGAYYPRRQLADNSEGLTYVPPPAW